MGTGRKRGRESREEVREEQSGGRSGEECGRDGRTGSPSLTKEPSQAKARRINIL